MMNKQTRNILIAVGLVLTIVFGLISFGGYKVYSFFAGSDTSSVDELPEELRQPRVTKGANFLTKNEIFKLKQNGYWTTVLKSFSIPDAKERQKSISAEVSKYYWGFSDIAFFDDKIVAVGDFGASVFDTDGNLLKEILFEPVYKKQKVFGIEIENSRTVREPKIIKLAEGRFGFLSLDNAEFVDIYDDEGENIWQYGREIDIDSLGKTEEERDEAYDKLIRVAGAAVGDLDGDGKAEYVVARYNDGIYAFDQNGNEKWFQPEDKPKRDLSIFDLEGEGNSVILETGKNSRIRNEKGEIIRNLGAVDYQGYLIIADGKDKEKTIQFLDITENKLTIKDENGNVLLQTEAPISSVKLKKSITEYGSIYENGSYTKDSESVYPAKAVWVKLQPDKPKYLAVVASFDRLSRANFYVYEADGNLIYHELLPENAETIAVGGAANQLESVVIGAKNTIWKFEAK